MTKTFEQFIQEFEKRGYKTSLISDGVTYIEGKGIKATVSEELYLPNWYLSGAQRLVVENANVFDKWSRCPMYMSIEDAIANIEQVFEYLDWLASPEGEKYSNNFEYLDEKTRKMPFNLPESMV